MAAALEEGFRKLDQKVDEVAHVVHKLDERQRRGHDDAQLSLDGLRARLDRSELEQRDLRRELEASAQAVDGRIREAQAAARASDAAAQSAYRLAQAARQRLVLEPDGLASGSSEQHKLHRSTLRRQLVEREAIRKGVKNIFESSCPSGTTYELLGRKL